MPLNSSQKNGKIAPINVALRSNAEKMYHVNAASVPKPCLSFLNKNDEVREKDVEPFNRCIYEDAYGKNNVFNTKELQAKYTVVAFQAPFVVVKEKDPPNRKGTLEFSSSPRLYFHFIAEK
jgi:hypothetical protein